MLVMGKEWMRNGLKGGDLELWGRDNDDRFVYWVIFLSIECCVCLEFDDMAFIYVLGSALRKYTIKKGNFESMCHNQW